MFACTDFFTRTEQSEHAARILLLSITNFRIGDTAGFRSKSKLKHLIKSTSA